MDALDALRKVAASGPAMSALDDASCVLVAWQPPTDGNPDAVPAYTLGDLVRDTLAANGG